jgi:ketosteroid isomerase-like protein
MICVRFFLCVFAGALLAGCTMSCPFIRKTTPVPAAQVSGSESKNSALAEWREFYNDYCSAVRARDQKALGRMMRRDFILSGKKNPSADQVFAMLDAQGGRGWAQMERALSRGTVAQRLPNMTEEGRVAKFRPADSSTSVWVIFQQSGGGRWLWSGLMTPSM